MYSINLFNEAGKPIRSYKSDILPIIGDLIVINGNTLFRVNNRVLPTDKLSVVTLIGSLIPNTFDYDLFI
jgi:hypothetical protein